MQPRGVKEHTSTSTICRSITEGAGFCADPACWSNLPLKITSMVLIPILLLVQGLEVFVVDELVEQSELLGDVARPHETAHRSPYCHMNGLRNIRD